MGQLVVVAGATGYAGRHLVVELAAQGYEVRALVRSEEQARQPGAFGSPSLEGSVAQWRVVDYSSRDSVHDVCAGADRVVSALGVTRQKSQPWDIDYLGNLALLTDAEKHGLSSFLYINVIGAERGSSMLMRSKHAFSEALSRSDVDGQIVNPSGYFSDTSDFFRMAEKGMGFLVGAGDARFNPIHGEDLAAFAVSKLAGPAGTWDVGGPDVYTYAELEQLCFEVAGARPRILRLGKRGKRVIEWAADRVSPQASNLARFFLESLVVDAVGDPFGKHRLRPYFESLKTPASTR